MSRTSLLRTKKLPVRAILASGAALGLGTMLTFAAFTDTGSVTADFATGTVNIAFDDNEDGNPTPYNSRLKLENAQIGSSTYETLLVKNNGSLPFSYTATASLDTGSNADLAKALQIRVVTVEKTEDCGDKAFQTRGNGNSKGPADAVKDAPFISIANVSDLDLAVSEVLYAADGAGDANRPASSDSAEAKAEADLFCFNVTLPGSQTGNADTDNAADNILQNTKADITIDFVATQLTS